MIWFDFVLLGQQREKFDVNQNGIFFDDDDDDVFYIKSSRKVNEQYGKDVRWKQNKAEKQQQQVQHMRAHRVRQQITMEPKRQLICSVPPSHSFAVILVGAAVCCFFISVKKISRMISCAPNHIFVYSIQFVYI